MSEQNIPNTEDLNPDGFEETSTEGVNPENPTEDANSDTVDYKEKFINSSKGAQDLLEKNKRLEAEREELRSKIENQSNHSNEPLYPGFENLSDNERENIVAYTESITANVLRKLESNPTFASAQERSNELKWEQGFQMVASAYPELQDSKEEFKDKYFQKDNVPDNIDTILGDLAKVYLFDKAKEIGIREGKEEKEERITPPRNIGGSGGEDKKPKLNKTAEEWTHIQATNPASIAGKLAEQLDEDLASGLL